MNVELLTVVAKKNFISTKFLFSLFALEILMKPPLRYHMYSFRLQMGATAIIIIIIITGARAFMAVYMCSSWSLDSGLQPFKSLQQRIDTEEGRIICMKVKPHLLSFLSSVCKVEEGRARYLRELANYMDHRVWCGKQYWPALSLDTPRHVTITVKSK